MGKKKDGAKKFDDFYGAQYGDRWSALKEALTKPKNHVALLNPLAETHPEGEEIFPGVIKAEAFDRPVGNEYYLLDAASVLAPLALDVQEGETVLDMCAAPGGKSLVLGYALNGTGKLISNDRSRDRRERLRKVLTGYLPTMDNVKLTGHDATTWGLHEQNIYDKILLDAPCSSEKHVLESPSHLVAWASGRTKRLALAQGAMVLAAYEALKPGGFLVYSTCSISELENDKVIEKLVSKKEGVKIHHRDMLFGEKTEFGTLILPDRSEYGPFYLAIIEKV